MESRKVLKKNPDMVSREIEGETILLPIYKTSKDINCIYTLNKVGGAVWNLIDGKKTLGDIKEIILEKFDTTSEEVDKEIAKFLKDLKEIKAVG